MLRLEKPTSSDNAYVTLRENSRMFTPTFIRALGLAFCLHLGGLILFHVQPFRISFSNTQYPPVQVKIEIALPDSAIYADLEVKDPRRSTLSEPAVPEPLVARLSLNSPNHLEVFPAEKSFPTTAITMDDAGALVSEWITFDPAPVQETKAPQIKLSGALTARSPILDTLPVPSPQKNSTERLLYSVKIDDQTGSIFWYANLVGDVRTQEAEALLKSIRFEPLPNGFVTEGQIELYVAGSVK